MMRLGSRNGGETLEQAIAADLDAELEQCARAGRIVIADRGLGLFDQDGADGACYLTLDDVARIAAKRARAWF